MAEVAVAVAGVVVKAAVAAVAVATVIQLLLPVPLLHEKPQQRHWPLADRATTRRRAALLCWGPCRGW